MPEFLQPVRRSDLFDLLQLARKRAESAGEPLPKRFCVVSYGLDLASREGPKTQADYARIWGWSASWVSKHIGGIAEEAEAQRTFYRADRDEKDRGGAVDDAWTPRGDGVANDPPSKATDAEKEQNRGDGVAGSWRSRGDGVDTNRSHYSDYKKKGGGGGSAPAREDFGFLSERDEVHRPEIEDAATRTDDLADPGWLAWLAEEKWPRPPAGAYLTSRSEKYGPAILAAGLVIAAADKTDPHTAYLESILKRLHEQQQRTEAGRSPEAPRRSSAGGSDWDQRRGWWPDDDWGRKPATA